MSILFSSVKQMAIVVVLFLSFGFLVSCSKQEETKLTLSVKKVRGLDTLIAPYARVFISRGDIKESGTADKDGVFSVVLKGESYLLATAQVDTINMLPSPDSVFVPHYYKQLDIHVEPEKENFKTIFVNTNFQDTLIN